MMLGGTGVGRVRMRVLQSPVSPPFHLRHIVSTIDYLGASQKPARRVHTSLYQLCLGECICLHG